MSQIRLLVDRVTEALGASATPAQVEAVVRIMLNEVVATQAPPRPPRAQGTAERGLITAYGRDQTGILHAITSVVSEMGCNILDVSQKILQGNFTLIMVVDLQPMQGSLQDLKQRLDAVSAERKVRIMAQHEDLFNAMHRP